MTARDDPRRVALRYVTSMQSGEAITGESISEEGPFPVYGAGKKRETVEILDLDARGIHVAEYLTERLPRKLLEQHLHEAIENAQASMLARAEPTHDREIAATSKDGAKRSRTATKTRKRS
jgi:hypothetical protein